MARTKQTNDSITLDVNMYQFINEYLADVEPGQVPQFDYNHFIDLIHDSHSESIEIKNGCVNTLENYDCMMDFYTEYGLLRYAYEVEELELKITEEDCDRTGNRSYWKYTVQLSENRLPVEIQFYTRWRITDFQEYEDEHRAAVLDELREQLSEKPVLLLESEPELFKRACQEIAGAIQGGYYRDITDFKHPNYLEVMNWIGYGNQFIDGSRSMCMAEKAVDRAFNWFKDGINAGLIYDNIKK